MNLKLIADLDFAGKLNAHEPVTESGKEMLKNYKGYLFNNEVTYGLVNGFCQEASQCSFDTGMMSILESVLKYINENNVSWKLASAAEYISRDNSSYNKISKAALTQVNKLLEMKESEVVQYIKAGALKNVQYVPEFRQICKEVFGTAMVSESVTPQYSLTNPISYVIKEEGNTYYTILGRTFKVTDEGIEEAACSNNLFNSINSILPYVTITSEGLEYSWNLGYGNSSYNFKVNESGINFKKGNIDVTFESIEKFREYADTYSRALTLNEKSGFMHLVNSMCTLFEGIENIVEIDTAKILQTSNGTVLGLVECGSNMNLIVAKSYKSNPLVHSYTDIKECLKDVTELSGINLESNYTEKIAESLKVTTEDVSNDTRKQKIEQLAEQYKNDPARIAILNAIAKDLATI